MVDKINWQRAGSITAPGRYMFTFGWLTVTANDLAIWNMYPQASFTLVELPAPTNASDESEEFHGSEFHLGTFELPVATSH